VITIKSKIVPVCFENFPKKIIFFDFYQSVHGLRVPDSPTQPEDPPQTALSTPKAAESQQTPPPLSLQLQSTAATILHTKKNSKSLLLKDMAACQPTQRTSELIYY
jgi:hypothetical protein